jgi:hypothetical protein
VYVLAHWVGDQVWGMAGQRIRAHPHRLTSLLVCVCAVVAIGKMLTEFTGLSMRWEPLFWLAFYVAAVGLHTVSATRQWACKLAQPADACTNTRCSYIACTH